MKNTFYVAVLAALSLSSLKADYVEKAITKGRPDAIKALVKAGFTYSEDKINDYIELAETKVEQKKEALDSLSLGHLTGPDVLLAGVNGAALTASCLLLYKHYHDDYKWDDVMLMNWAMFTGALTGSLKSLITLYKDVKKKDKKIEAIEKAEKVLRAVKMLKVALPEIAAS